VNAFHLWLTSVWSHHPTTWQTWAEASYVLVATIALFMVVFGRKLGPVIFLLAGLSALGTGIGAAVAHKSFDFWLWMFIGTVILIEFFKQMRARRKRKAAAVKS